MSANCVILVLITSIYSSLVVHTFSTSTGSHRVDQATMSTDITQQDRVAVATHLRQWALARNFPQNQVDRMINDLLAGHHDAQIQRAAPLSQPRPVARQPSGASSVPAFIFRTPFGMFLVPQNLVPIFMPHALALFSMPAATGQPIPNPTFLSTAPASLTLTARTTMPGEGESIKYSTAYSSRQDDMAFSYSSSSTSTSFQAATHHFIHPIPMVSAMNALLPAPSVTAAPIRLAPAIKPTIQALPPPRIATAAQAISRALSFTVSAPQVPANGNAAVSQAPQNPRLAQKFGQQPSQQT